MHPRNKGTAIFCEQDSFNPIVPLESCHRKFRLVDFNSKWHEVNVYYTECDVRVLVKSANLQPIELFQLEIC
jgi:hypothetical protein